jgi:small subunit ribosomal protein S11
LLQKPSFLEKRLFFKSACVLKSNEEYAIVHIKMTHNNTSILVTNPDGNILFWATSRSCGFKSPKRGSYMASVAVGEEICDRIIEENLKFLKITFKARQKKRKLRNLLKLFKKTEKRRKFKILSLINLNTIPYNGCKKKKKRKT